MRHTAEHQFIFGSNLWIRFGFLEKIPVGPLLSMATPTFLGDLGACENTRVVIRSRFVSRHCNSTWVPFSQVHPKETTKV